MGGQSIIYFSEEALRLFLKKFVTSAIPMVRWYVAEMEIITQIVSVAVNLEEEWAKLVPFPWGTPLSQWHEK